jgi:hypothetical protein
VLVALKLCALNYPETSSSLSRVTAAVTATVETEEAASLAGSATLLFPAITLPRGVMISYFSFKLVHFDFNA